MRALLAILFAAALAAQDLKRVEPQGYVSDFANVVSPASRGAINSYLKSLEETTGVQIAIVTIPSLGGDSIENVAADLYNRWGVGRQDTKEGALYLFAIQDRKSRLEVGYGLEEILPDAAAGDILRAMRPALRERLYGEAFIEAARNLGERIAKAKGVEIAAALPPSRSFEARPQDGPTTGDIILWVVIIAGLFLFFRAAGRNAKRRAGRRWRGPWYIPSGGGFGGSSSGGGSSWGGFGGGSSGGGGASSDW